VPLKKAPRMTSPRPNARAKLLASGLHMISQEGLGGVTLGRLAQQVGISKSGVFAHFHSKDQVQIALLDHSAELAARRVVEPALREPDGLPRLRALVANWFGWAERASLPGGCPVAAAMFELDDVDGPVRDKVAQMSEEWSALVVGAVQRAVDLGHLRADLDVEQFVWELFGMYLGHHASSRFVRYAGADERAKTALDGLFARAQLGVNEPARRATRAKTSKRTKR
jgi:AcrR family transcriptional regulator